MSRIENLVNINKVFKADIDNMKLSITNIYRLKNFTDYRKWYQVVRAERIENFVYKIFKVVIDNINISIANIYRLKELNK